MLHTKTRLILFSSLLAISISFFTLYHYAVAAVPAIHPLQVEIPSIKAKSPIVDVGVTDKGNLDVPNNFVQVGWYKYGSLPGAQGSSVLDAHVDNGGKVPGPFKNLRNAKVGDDIFVTLDNGNKVHYVITSLAVYDYKKFPSNLVFQNTNDSLLKLITCHGIFLSKEKTYSKRLVVTAKLV